MVGVKSARKQDDEYVRFPSMTSCHGILCFGSRRSMQFLLLLAWVALGQEEARERPPVSWVNPKLPDGPGLSHHVLSSEALGHDAGYVVWTPADFDSTGKTRYAVIYFLHGIGGNESADAAGFSGYVASAIQDGTLPPAICVFPNGGRSGYRGQVESMIVKELIPLIDRDYPTRASASGRAVAGFSMGGAGAVRLSLLHPELFAVAGSWGGGMWRDAEEMLAAVEPAAETLKASDFGVLLVNGGQDHPDAFTRLAEKMAAAGVRHQIEVLPDTPHNLGLYYEKNGDRMMKFLGDGLKSRADE
jgi:endo-1,4-beta-xylanase